MIELMSIEDIAYLMVLIFLGLLSLVGLFYAKTMYINPKAIPVKAPIWWPYDKKWWKKWAGAAPMLSVIMPFAVMSGFLLEYGDTSKTVVGTLALGFLFFTLFGVLFNLFIVLTGRPKWIIPKHLR